MCWTWIVMSGGTLSSANSVCASLVCLWLFSSDWFLMLFCASCLTFTIFSQAVLSNKKSFQQERLCIKRLLFTKSSVWVTWALSAQPYCNTIWNSCLVLIWCFLSVEACCLFCISLHTIWAICLVLTSFWGQYDPSFSLLPVDTELKYNPNLVTGVPFLPDTPVGFLLMSTFLPRIDIGSLFWCSAHTNFDSEILTGYEFC